MKKIVGIIQPFVINQQILVYENGNKIDATNSTILNMNKNILTFVDMHDVTTIELIGPKSFTQKVEKDLRKEELIRYGKNILEIKRSSEKEIK